MNTPQQIGDLIAILRKERGLTQQDLADRLKIAKGTVTHYEAGRNNFTVNTLSRIADALDCDFSIQMKAR